MEILRVIVFFPATKGGRDFPEGMEAGNLSDDEREGGKEKEKKKKLKKKKVLISVPIGSLCYSTDNLSHKYYLSCVILPSDLSSSPKVSCIELM